MRVVFQGFAAWAAELSATFPSIAVQAQPRVVAASRELKDLYLSSSLTSLVIVVDDGTVPSMATWAELEPSRKR